MVPRVPHLGTQQGNAGAEQVLWTRGYWATGPTCTDVVKMSRQGPAEKAFQVALLRREKTYSKDLTKIIVLV